MMLFVFGSTFQVFSAIKSVMVFVLVLPDPFGGLGGTEEFRRDPTVGPCPKMWTRDQKWKK